MHLRPIPAGLTFLILCQAFACSGAQQSDSAVTPVAVADEVCARCHDDIFHKYLNTPMANASGRARDHSNPGDLFHAPSRTTYRVYAEDNSLWLSYSQTGNSGRQKLEYFLGSGHLGLTYLYTVNGYLLETPVAYYANTKAYDMKPGLGYSTRMPAALPMSPGCMRCHMSGVQRAESGTKNRYQELPFLHGGITCESCHGDTKEHVRTSGRAPVINPIKLDAGRRDSICISCHLEGDTSVEHRGRSVLDYRPGERIEDYVSYFVFSGVKTNQRGVSEIEQLSLSLCKRRSGDHMSCMSCHDPHSSPAVPERAAFYRSKCLACHTQTKFVQDHYPSNPDCTACHMPTSKAENIPHVAWTDHRIRQHPQQESAEGVPASPELIPLLGSPAQPRDLALAYYNLTADGKLSQAARAGQMLLAVQKSDPPDPDVLTALGFLAPSLGMTAQAANFYREALKLDPQNLFATNNLATLLAKSGQFNAAVLLWQSAFDRNEDIESLGINLALAECSLDHRDKAVQVLQRVLLYNPGSPKAHEKLQALQTAQETCSPHKISGQPPGPLPR